MVKVFENIKIRKSAERGFADRGWLQTRFTFSFADYYDEEHLSFRALKVLNNDRIDPGKGFGLHAHKDMEIISYVVEGELEHADDMGNHSIIEAGNVQKISAGTGIHHSEFNPSKEHPTIMYQIWIEPRTKGLVPSYQELALRSHQRENALTLFASSDVASDRVFIDQDVQIYYGLLERGRSLEHLTRADRGVWFQLIQGALTVNGVELVTGDGISFEHMSRIRIQTRDHAKFLLFDLS